MKTAFGSLLPGKQYNSSTYKFGFNGMEKDDEEKGVGNSYTSEYRQYDPRLCRWTSIDPRASQFPWQSPYVAFDNCPILKRDPKGDSPPTLAEIVSKGMSSERFTQLFNTAGLTVENMSTIVSFGEDTYTTDDGKIVLASSKTVEQYVIMLSHEMTNKINDAKFDALDNQVMLGEITPDEYATKYLEVETQSVVNQIIVAAEANIEMPQYKSVIDKYKTRFINGYTEEKLKQQVGKAIQEAKTEDGSSAHDYYKKQGQDARDQYLKEHPELKAKEEKGGQGDSIPQEKKKKEEK